MPSDRQHAHKKQPLSQRRLSGSHVRRIVEIGHKLGKVPPFFKIVVPATLLFLNLNSIDAYSQNKGRPLAANLSGSVKKAPKYDITQMKLIADGVYLDNSGTKISVICLNGDQRDFDLLVMKGPDGKTFLNVLGLEKFDAAYLVPKRYVNKELGIQTVVLFHKGASGLFYVNQHMKGVGNTICTVSLPGTEVCSNFPIVGEGEWLLSATTNGRALLFSAYGRGSDAIKLSEFISKGITLKTPQVDTVEDEKGNLYFEVSEFGIEADIPVPKLPPAVTAM